MVRERDGAPLKDTEQKHLLASEEESTASKLLRSADLLIQGSAQGAVSRAKEAVANPASTAVEIVAAAGAGAALAALQKSGGAYRVAGNLLAIGLTGVAANDVYSRGVDAAPAFRDNWNSANNFRDNKITVGSTIGSAIFDYSIMGAAGLAGYKWGGIGRQAAISPHSFEAPTAPNSSPSMSSDRLAAFLRETPASDLAKSMKLIDHKSLSFDAGKLQFKLPNASELTVTKRNVLVPAILPTYMAGMDGSSQVPMLEAKGFPELDPSGSLQSLPEKFKIKDLESFKKEWQPSNLHDREMLETLKTDFFDRSKSEMLFRKGPGFLRQDQLPKELRHETE